MTPKTPTASGISRLLATTPAALVCASCRRPVERTFDDDFQHESVDDGLACTAWPVRPARAGEPHPEEETGR
jgi:hypothetical protein